MTTAAALVRQAPAPSVARTWTALVAVYLVWGSTYLGIRVVVDSGIPPLLGMGTRFLVAAPLLAAFVAVRGGAGRLRIGRRELVAAGVVGTLLITAGNGGVAVAEQTVPSGLAALLVAAVPLLLVLLRVGRGERPAGLVWLGVAVGFAGVALLAVRGGGIAEVQPWGLAVMAVAVTCWATGSFFSRPLGVPADALVATTWEMALGGAALVVVGLLVGEAGDVHLERVSGAGWAAMAYLVLVGSLVGYTAYAWLLQNVPISLTGTYAYVNPAVAVALGALILDEPVTAVVLVGGSLALVGVALVVSAERLRR
jgi:drug/metabolite transporter (DMT)-like permease